MPAEKAARKFHMADLMILIAGCGVALAWTQRFSQFLDEGMPSGMHWRFKIFRLAMPILIPMSLALLACRLRPPRPRLRSLLVQPGALLLLCMALATTAEGLSSILGHLVAVITQRIVPTNPYLINDRSLDIQFLFRFTEVGPLVGVVCWSLLRTSGLWKSEPTWIDRAGRALGVAWIICYFARTIIVNT